MTKLKRLHDNIKREKIIDDIANVIIDTKIRSMTWYPNDTKYNLTAKDYIIYIYKYIKRILF